MLRLFMVHITSNTKEVSAKRTAPFTNVAVFVMEMLELHRGNTRVSVQKGGN
jgi:hypothetical protein